MTRDELEAFIWRQIPRIDAGTMDSILAAAEAYAITEAGLTAERRQILAEATDPLTHHVRDRSGIRGSACGRAGCGRETRWSGTHDPAKVTCAACKRTGFYQQALAGAA